MAWLLLELTEQEATDTPAHKLLQSATPVQWLDGERELEEGEEFRYVYAVDVGESGLILK